ncbi:MAG: UMP kinase [Candidatus Asgardarchaeia archaeon]
MKVVLKLGGSILYDNTFNLNIQLIQNYVELLKNFTEKGYQFFIVTGGGVISKSIISTFKQFNLSNFYNDMIGIYFSRVNAFIVASLLSSLAFPAIPTNWDDVMKLFPQLGKKILVMGGMQPGQSTNAVAALLAELVSADLLVNMTNVDGVYDKNPSDPRAQLLKEITINELIKIVEKLSQSAGTYKLFDLVAAKVVSRSKIPLVFINGRNPENLRKLLSGESVGTKVLSGDM